MTTSKKHSLLQMRVAAASSILELTARMPPYAAMGSPAIAKSTACATVFAIEQPQGLVCLITHAPG